MIYLFYIIIYVILGIFTGFITLFYKDLKDNNIHILFYLFGCIFLWPAVLINTIISIICLTIREYCSQ